MSHYSQHSIWWMPRRHQLLQVVIALMAAAAVLKLGDEFRRLLWDSNSAGAADLKRLHRWVELLFTGQTLLQQRGAVYPPATYIILWLLSYPHTPSFYPEWL